MEVIIPTIYLTYPWYCSPMRYWLLALILLLLLLSQWSTTGLVFVQIINVHVYALTRVMLIIRYVQPPICVHLGSCLIVACDYFSVVVLLFFQPPSPYVWDPPRFWDGLLLLVVLSLLFFYRQLCGYL